jgi:hypothetical protein
MCGDEQLSNIYLQIYDIPSDLSDQTFQDNPFILTLERTRWMSASTPASLTEPPLRAENGARLQRRYFLLPPDVDDQNGDARVEFTLKEDQHDLAAQMLYYWVNSDQRENEY